MTSSISTNSHDYNAAVDAIRAEVETYCEVNGIDPEEYLSNLDANLQKGIFDNATFDAYFQLAYMQLMDILYPEVINSLEAEVGGKVNFETLYENSDDDVRHLLGELIQDDPELMSFFARLEAGEAEEDAVAELINQIYISSQNGNGEDRSFTEDARAFADKYNVKGVSILADKEEMFKAAEMSILDRLAEYDEETTKIMDMLKSGEISETEADAQLQDVYYGRESLMSMLQAVTEAESTFFQMMTKLYEQQKEMTMAIVNNMRGA